MLPLIKVLEAPLTRVRAQASEDADEDKEDEEEHAHNVRYIQVNNYTCIPTCTFAYIQPIGHFN